MSMASELSYLMEWVESLQEQVREQVEKWREREGSLIMILHAIQNVYGYVPRGVANELAKQLEMPLARIYEVITFYNYFRLEPPGKHTVQVCTGTACYLKGAEGILRELERQLKVKEGESTSDGEFHLETVRCIGCCGMSPAIVVDGKTHGRLRALEVGSIIDGKRKGQV